MYDIHIDINLHNYEELSNIYDKNYKWIDKWEYFRFLSSINDLIIIGAMHDPIWNPVLLRTPCKHHDQK